MNFNFDALKRPQAKGKAINKKKPSGGDLFGGMDFGDSSESAPSPDATMSASALSAQLPGARASSGSSELDSLFGSVSFPAAAGRVPSPVAPQMAPPPAVAPPSPMDMSSLSSSLESSIPSAAPSFVPVSAGSDPSQRFHSQLSSSMSQVQNEFEQSHREESVVREKLRELEMAKSLLRDANIQAQERQNNALAMEDYSSADQANQEIATNRSKLEELDAQKSRGLQKLKETQSKKCEKLEKSLQLFVSGSRSLDQVLKNKEIENTRLRETHGANYLRMSSQYNQFKDRVDSAESSTQSLLMETQSRIDSLEAQIYAETKSDSDERSSLIAHKSELDNEIQELERRLGELRQESQGCQQAITRCENAINTVRRTHGAQLTPLQMQLKRAEDDGRRLSQEQDKASQMLAQMESTKAQYDAQDTQKDHELSGLREESELMQQSVESLQSVSQLYASVATGHDSPEVSRLRGALAERKRALEQQLQQRQQREQSLASERERLQSLETNLPLWEDQKKKAVASKNFALAGKLSGQVKKAQMDQESLRASVSACEADLGQFDQGMQEYRLAIDQAQEDLDREQSREDSAQADCISDIVQNLQTCQRALELNQEVDAGFRTAYSSFFENFVQAFESQRNSLYESSGLAVSAPRAPTVSHLQPSLSAFDSLAPRSLPGSGKPGVVSSMDPMSSFTKLSSVPSAPVPSPISALEAQLEAASQSENYDLCEKLQAQIDALHAHLG